MSTQQIIFITGATAGIGRAAAFFLAERGHRVIASGRKREALDAMQAEAEAAGLSLDTVALDVTDDASIAAAKARADALTGGRGIDVLINNAGYGLGAPVIEATDEDLRKQFDTNVFGLMAVTRAFVPDMIARGHGRVINVSSVGGRITFPMMGVYHASKYALEALSDALRMELQPFGVHVSIIEPGPIQTQFVATLNDQASPYKQPGSRYAPVFERAEVVEARTMAMAPGPLTVAKAIHRAATSRRPRARYVAPGHNLLTLALLKMIPVRWRDALMRAVFGLTSRRLRAANTEPQLASEVA